ncbi:hypothetical protein K435DRAFT_890403 [Dendrothele bispora CBS 962.96]|uniref:Uncharacterized protein n=1 Tax=Dendrothele bispora (strain CBS 962.96) TaxID=1314807 RepID=A0A4S8MSC1_DENBC|nr:hypothetical protein K435DRAFT_890403 [Dendrothele bispora CBS 962.96]
MSHHSTPKLKILSYSDAVQVFKDEDIIANLRDACQKLAQSSVALMATFEDIYNQLHSLDMQGVAPPLKPIWNTYRKEFAEIVWQQRVNAGFISGRLKMFCTVVLPLTVRNNTGSTSSHHEKIHVLRSYMNISSDHAALTRTLVDKSLQLSANINSFHTDLAKLASQRANGSQRELQELARKLTELENTVRQLVMCLHKLRHIDVTYLAISALRLSSFSGRRPSRTKITHHRLAFPGPDLNSIGKLYERLDATQNEIVHAHYAAQVSHRRTDVLTTARTAIAKLVSDEILTIEAKLSFFMSIWLRLQTDCVEIMRWLENSRNNMPTPASVHSYMESGLTLYASIADALDIYVAGIDPSHFTASGHRS